MPRSMRARPRRSAWMRRSRTIRTSQRWSTYVGRGAIRFYLPLNVQLPNDFFTQAVVVAKDVAARERLHVKLEKSARGGVPEARSRASRRSSSGHLSAGRSQYRVSGPDVEQVREIALKVGRSSLPIRTPERQFRLDGARRGRSASGSTRTRRVCWASARSDRDRAQRRDIGYARHPGPRRHLSRRSSSRGRPTNSGFRCDNLRTSAGAAAGRTDRAARASSRRSNMSRNFP